MTNSAARGKGASSNLVLAATFVAGLLITACAVYLGFLSLVCFYATGEDADLGQVFNGCDWRTPLATGGPVLVLAAVGLWRLRPRLLAVLVSLALTGMAYTLAEALTS